MSALLQWLHLTNAHDIVTSLLPLFICNVTVISIVTLLHDISLLKVISICFSKPAWTLYRMCPSKPASTLYRMCPLRLFTKRSLVAFTMKLDVISCYKTQGDTQCYTSTRNTQIRTGWNKRINRIAQKLIRNMCKNWVAFISKMMTIARTMHTFTSTLHVYTN